MIKDSLDKKQLQRLASRVKKYGITMDEFLHLLEKQNKCCPICENELELFGSGKSAIDHCHITNNVRGIICHQCNVWIGMYEARGLKLSNMINYLRNGDHLIPTKTVNRYSRPGRPSTGKAKTARERMAAHRARKKALKENLI